MTKDTKSKIFTIKIEVHEDKSCTVEDEEHGIKFALSYWYDSPGRIKELILEPLIPKAST